MTSPAQAHIADTLERAQRAFTTSLDPESANHREAVSWFIHHVTVTVLLENLRRLDTALADQLTNWMLTQDGIFGDGYAGELLYQWRQQHAAGQPLHPINPAEALVAADDSVSGARSGGGE